MSSSTCNKKQKKLSATIDVNEDVTLIVSSCPEKLGYKNIGTIFLNVWNMMLCKFVLKTQF